MSLQGPILLVADTTNGELVQAFAAAGAFPVVEATWPEAFKAAVSINPSVIVAAPPSDAEAEAAQALAQHAAASKPLTPLVVRGGGQTLDGSLAVPEAASPDRLIARVTSALRVRTLHATVIGRAATLKTERNIVAEMPDGDPLDTATTLVVGRGPAYPALSVAVGERMGVIGALNLDFAAGCLAAREVDGVIVGDGLPWRAVEAFLETLAADRRFRELPVAVLGADGDVPGLPHLVCAREPRALLDCAIPLIRLRALESSLKRLLQSIESKGMLDPQTGLFHPNAFGEALNLSIADAAERGSTLSLARFSFDEPLDRRTGMDASRLVSRLVRDVDFACRDEDGSILFVFADTDLRAAHVAARRLASVLKHTMLRPGRDRPPLTPSVTLATLKPSDTALTLLTRVTPRPVAAA
ncbi:MAG: GGDEF domain-containing protein [Alphaproteobacteria bacterium]|nr:GGDEF domain-containing protein [Alphaproteobacteria bacterium]